MSSFTAVWVNFLKPISCVNCPNANLNELFSSPLSQSETMTTPKTEQNLKHRNQLYLLFLQNDENSDKVSSKVDGYKVDCCPL